MCRINCPAFLPNNPALRFWVVKQQDKTRLVNLEHICVRESLDWLAVPLLVLLMPRTVHLKTSDRVEKALAGARFPLQVPGLEVHLYAPNKW